jgi:hypothetical protein
MFSQNCGLLNNGLIAERGNCLFLLRDAAGCKNKIQINPGFYSDSESCGAEQYHGDFERPGMTVNRVAVTPTCLIPNSSRETIS